MNRLRGIIILTEFITIRASKQYFTHNDYVLFKMITSSLSMKSQS